MCMCNGMRGRTVQLIYRCALQGYAIYVTGNIPEGGHQTRCAHVFQLVHVFVVHARVDCNSTNGLLVWSSKGDNSNPIYHWDVIYAAADMLGPLLDANLVLDHC